MSDVLAERVKRSERLRKTADCINFFMGIGVGIFSAFCFTWSPLEEMLAGPLSASDELGVASVLILSISVFFFLTLFLASGIGELITQSRGWYDGEGKAFLGLVLGFIAGGYMLF